VNWILYLSLGAISVSIVNCFYRSVAPGKLYLFLILIVPLALSKDLIFYRLGFLKAPSFFQAWFLSQIILSLTGFFISILFYEGIISFKHYIGLILAFISGFLLV